MKKFISVRFNEREKFWIKTLNCKVPNGYNIASGGQGNSKIEKFSTNKKIFTMRMQPENFDKIRVIAAINKRSVAMQIEYLIENCIANYETNYGQIPLAMDESQKNSAIINNQFGNNNLQVTTI